MCVAEPQFSNEPLVSSVGGSGYIEHVSVLAPQVTLNTQMLDSVDWGEVARIGAIGTLAGATQGQVIGSIPGAIIGGVATTAVALESQPGVDLSELFGVTNGIPIIPGLPAPYIPLY